MPMYRLAEVTVKALKRRKLGGTRLSTFLFKGLVWKPRVAQPV